MMRMEQQGTDGPITIHYNHYVDGAKVGPVAFAFFTFLARRLSYRACTTAVLLAPVFWVARVRFHVLLYRLDSCCNARHCLAGLLPIESLAGWIARAVVRLLPVASIKLSTYTSPRPQVGTPETLEVDLVIGADGANSRVAKEIDAGEADYAIAFQVRERTTYSQ